VAGEGSGNGDARHAQVSRDLRKAGFDETQAEALIAVVQEASTLDLSNLATKNDLAAVRSDLAVARSEMKNDLAALRSEMKKTITPPPGPTCRGPSRKPTATR